MTAGSACGWAAVVLGVVCLVLQFDSISCNFPMFGTVNRSVTFPIASSVPFTEILWTKNRDKVVEWEAGSPVRVFPPFIRRVHLDTTSGSLTIFNLTYSDEADYKLDSLSSGDTLFTLKVIDPLPSPTLNCTLAAEDITVNCRIPESYSFTQLLNYSWNCFPALCKNGSNMSEVVIKRNNDLSQEIRCTVNSPLSKQTSLLVLATCVPAEHSRNRFAIIPAVIIPLAGVIFLVFQKRCSEIWQRYREN
ncbi:lymphocyte function-associated antigen 3 isoform X1 [Mustela nigripes]|uniref:lymphocyte function-associated antigen 3 isoform X1 n=1 Tax=Mustela lutreola TaxID=9666 RepID=UPI002797BC93|nr:lymphocyte function-associated antigen 3 isoform X1 [Mustela lutreola]XP_059231829.1 lymphocyte function-associated antigen 3 isoform X1 [Mustela nigripes]